MKNIILVIVVLLIFIGGLGWFLFTSDNLKEPPAKTKAAEDNNTKSVKVDDNATKPVKELTLEEKAIGTYELKEDGDTHRRVFLENGDVEQYLNGEKKVDIEAKWKVVEGEIHITDSDGFIGIFRINKDGSITAIATIRDGKREGVPKDFQLTLKKIK